jgi:hypothetical protein
LARIANVSAACRACVRSESICAKVSAVASPGASSVCAGVDAAFI